MDMAFQHDSDKKRPRSELEPVPAAALAGADNNNTSSAIHDKENETMAFVLETEHHQQHQHQNQHHQKGGEKEEHDYPKPNRQRTLNIQNITQMKLEAIFHPKFDNERQNNNNNNNNNNNKQQTIRQSMIDKVAKKEGILEVSLKHSGSLLLWSGGSRYYSKNGTFNMYTSVGEVLLRQHFARVWSDNNHDDKSPFMIVNEVKYKECSDYVESNRLTLSFEVVTSFLGHHGDIPNRDFLILIAVADRSTGTFYSTNEIIQFAQRFRLPHNDIWIFQSNDSASRLFDLYDTSREVGLANYVINRLSQTADGGHIKSLYPHTVFQGEILEGFVIRFVRVTTESEIQSISHYCSQSDNILKLVPPEKTLALSSSCDFDSIPLLKLDLRLLFAQNENQVAMTTLRKLTNISVTENEIKRTVTKLDKKEIDLPTIASKLLQNNNIDLETRKICNLIQTIADLSLSVNYHVSLEQNQRPNGRIISNRCICIIHIIHDECHQKYHIATRTTKGMTLFRGFSIELITDDISILDSSSSSTLECKMNKVQLQSHHEVDDIVNEGKLILKMKFLPYMVRTFICRNGLSVLEKKGSEEFTKYAYDKLMKWQISKEAVNKWLEFFHAWGIYCESPSHKDSSGTPLPTLTSSNYLHHFYHFVALHSKGFFNVKTKHTSSFCGLVVVVGINKNEMKDFAIRLSNELSCSRTTTDINALTEADIARSMHKTSGGIVCAAIITDGIKNLRNLAKRYKENIFVVMVGCSTEDIDAYFIKTEDPRQIALKKKNQGMANAWKKSSVCQFMELPHSCTSSKLQSDQLDNVIKKLKELSTMSAPDTRPGMLVFFPSIPGCGKSFLCNDISSIRHTKDRGIIVKEGDKTVGKFWSLVLQDKVKNPSSIFIADKNAPPASWDSIDSICSNTGSVAVCVIPDSPALEDTTMSVYSDIETRNTTIAEHNYPYSLPFLALCMSRVLKREPKTHNGKLDSATKDACMILVKFYCMYRNLTTKSLLNRISKLGRSRNRIIRIPFFREDKLPEMPKDLKGLLETAISIQTQLDLHMITSFDSLSLEVQLRNAILTHQGYIEGLSGDKMISRDSFILQLESEISLLGNQLEGKTQTVEETKCIRIVSLDLNRGDVNNVIEEISKHHPSFRNYLNVKKFGKVKSIASNDDDRKRDRFINNTHCTFAHSQQMSQGEMVQKYGDVIGSCCTLIVNAVLYDEKVAALQVSVPKLENGTPIPEAVNHFTHITIWCKKGELYILNEPKDFESFRRINSHKTYLQCIGINPKDSNQLPTKANEGLAMKIQLEAPLYVKGKFSYWYYY